MHAQLNTPYHPGLCNLSGTYRVNVGSLFYVGSTTNYGKRHSQHKCDLEAGTHPNKRLQDEFNATRHFEFIALTEIQRKTDDSDKDHTERLKLHEQWLLDAHKGDPNFANGSESSRHNTTIGDYMKAKWQDPQFRQAQILRMKSRRGFAVPAHTREKMSKAKRGKNNINSRPCVIHFQGQSHHFECVTDAAKHFGTTQQAMDQWMRGITPWPGSGKRKPKPCNAHLSGMTGNLL